MRLAVLLVALTACSNRARLDGIDTRLSAIESVRAKDRKAHDDAVARLPVLLERIGRDVRMARDNGTIATGIADELSRLADQLEELKALVEAAAATSGSAAAPPARRGRAEPDAKDVYAVPIDSAYYDGPADALVTIVRGYEYACPYCEKSRATMAELRRLYPDDVRIVYRSFVVHPQTATTPALAACAARRQGLFAEMDEALWDKAFAPRKFDTATIEQIAVDVGLDLDQLRVDMSGDCVTEIADDQADLKQVGVGATPTFFINGHYLAGAWPVADFAAIVDDELALARTRVKKGTKAAKYYKTWILGKGTKAFKP